MTQFQNLPEQIKYLIKSGEYTMHALNDSDNYILTVPPKQACCDRPCSKVMGNVYVVTPNGDAIEKHEYNEFKNFDIKCPVIVESEIWNKQQGIKDGKG